MTDSDRESIDVVRKRTGKLGEQIACSFLSRNGYEIVEKNFRRKWGEIDIIALKANSVRFVEVKAATQRKFSREMHHQPEEMVDARKLRKLARTAALYMEATKDGREYQIDVVAVILNEATRTARCRLIEQALEDNL